MSRRQHHEDDYNEDEENKEDENENDDDDEDGGKVLDLSGLTEEQRRQVRKEQRQLLKELEENRSMEMDEARRRNNTIYKNVKYTRDAVLDGENLMSIAMRASQNVGRLIQVPRYDADRLVLKLVEKVRKETNGGSSFQFDWETFGEAACACFNAIPSGICFLNGPLVDGQPPVQRKARRRVQQEDKDAVEERPEDVNGHTENDDNKLSAIEKSMQDMSRVLHKKVRERYNENKRKLTELCNGEIDSAANKKLRKYGVEIDGIQFLMNPQSFTQTVENIYHYSFLVKKDAASVQVREKGVGEEDGFVKTKPGLALKYIDLDAKKPIKKHTKSRQAIMTFTMQDWRELCETYQVEQGDLPTRAIKKDQHAASLSQASARRSP